MLWPNARLRRHRDLEIQERIAAARLEHPEAEPWLALLEAALGESEDGGWWEAGLPAPAADRPVKAPLLCRTEITLDERAARRWGRRLLKLGVPVNGRAGGAPQAINVLVLLEAAVNQDDASVDALARAAGMEPQAVRVVGQMAALPLLHACARTWAGAVPSAWWEGYCPLCGAWPVVAEYAGLERKRQLRCGRCGTAWVVPSLRCVFCDETDHEQLGYLTPESDEQMRRVEVCGTCKGYLKGVTTVRPLAARAILLDDLMTVHLDVAALERGYRRPERPGYALEARVRASGARKDGA
ncbi:MAG TPA: formate dehydrogenase accessory protein FdhE [Gemmatimonadales bacterium]|jgi:FdhE protein